MIIYRKLEEHEWERLLEYFTARGHADQCPSPGTAIAAIAEEDGQIVGTLIQQICWHREPLMINHSRVNFIRLNGVLDDAFKDYPNTVHYALTQNENVVKMAELLGMEVLDSNVRVLKGTS